MEIIIAIILMITCVAGIAIKILIKKNGEFSGTCSSNNPFLKNNEPCQYCGAKATQVHHKRYAKYQIGKEPIDWLVSVCGPCHKDQH